MGGVSKINVIIALFCAAASVKAQGVRYTKIIENSLSSRDDWWKSAVLYQIYPRSFKDSDNDGNGDLQGIIQKLDYFKEIGVTGIWLSSIYKSPQVDNGYDISDYRDIDSMYGSLEDLRQLVDEAHKQDLKVILDYVPNHTSDQHEWFQASLQKDPKYDAYYIWKNATYENGKRKAPNNWLSNFGGSAWEWNEARQQYYFHQFSAAQPDLNYRNPDVVNEMKDVLRYWLDFGVDGFRMDAVNTLFEDIYLRDEPKSGISNDPENYQYLNHTYTSNLNETLDMIYQFRDVLDEFNQKNGTFNRIMMTEVYSNVEETMLYYVSKAPTRWGAHFTFNFLSFIMLTKKGFKAAELVRHIGIWIENLPQGCTDNWVLGNHDQPRVSTRLGVNNIDGFNILASILDGVQITYQGEEIGQENGEVTCQQGHDPQAIKNCSTFNETSRDFQRTPFQWDNTTNAGFNEGNTTWLPVSKKYLETNLLKQNVSGANTHYNIYKSMVQLRKEFIKYTMTRIAWGTYDFTNLFYLERSTDYVDYIMVFNVDEISDQYLPVSFVDAKKKYTVVVRSTNSNYAIGDNVNLQQHLNPGEAVVFKISVKP